MPKHPVIPTGDANHGENPVIPEDPISVGEAATIAGVHTDTIKRWENQGRIRSFRTPSGHRRYNRGDVMALLTAQRSA